MVIEYVPALHVEQDEAPAEEYVPPLHMLHKEEPAAA